MSEENLKSEHTHIQWPVILKMYDNPFKLHALDLISFRDQINIYSQNVVCPLVASVAEIYQVVFQVCLKKKNLISY